MITRTSHRLKALPLMLIHHLSRDKSISPQCTHRRSVQLSIALLSGLLLAIGLLLFPQSAAADHQRNCTDAPTGEPIDYGEVVRCQINPAGDTDLYRFEGTEGEVVAIQVTGGGGFNGPNPCFRLFGPDFRLIEGVCTYPGGIARREYKLTQDTGGTGTYTIEVSENGNDQVLNYELNLLRTVPATLISYGSNRSGRIGHAGDIHFYNFVAGPSTNERVTVRVTGGGGFNGPNPCFRLVGPDGNRIREGCAYPGGVAEFEFTDLTNPGTYEIWVYENGYDQVYNYNLTLSCIGLCRPAPIDRHYLAILQTSCDAAPCEVGGEFTARVSLINPSPDSVELKFGYLLPDGRRINIGDPHRELPGKTMREEEVMGGPLPLGPPGRWQFCGRLLELQLGQTLAVDCRSFNIIPTSADLSVTMTASPNPVVPGAEVTYTITLANSGPDTARVVRVTDILPDTTTFVSCAATGGGVCSGEGNNRTVSFAALASGATETITIVARVNDSVPGGTMISNTATASAFTSDPNPKNNSATATVMVSKP